jgi:hypothetical protein
LNAYPASIISHTQQQARGSPAALPDPQCPQEQPARRDRSERSVVHSQSPSAAHPYLGNAVITNSGGEVDPETGNAFFYQTKEELKTVNTPLMSRKADGREEQIGFTSTTTKVCL